MLASDTVAPDQDTWNYKDDVTNEITGTGYTAGGATISSPSLTYNTSTNQLMFDGGDVEWTGATFTSRYLYIYDATPGTDATRPLIAYVDFGENLPVTAGTFKVAWNTSGICTITVA